MNDLILYIILYAVIDYIFYNLLKESKWLKAYRILQYVIILIIVPILLWDIKLLWYWQPIVFSWWFACFMAVPDLLYEVIDTIVGLEKRYFLLEFTTHKVDWLFWLGIELRPYHILIHSVVGIIIILILNNG